MSYHTQKTHLQLQEILDNFFVPLERKEVRNDVLKSFTFTSLAVE